MAQKKPAKEKGAQKKRAPQKHESNDPRRLTAEGWWRRKEEQTGYHLRPKEQSEHQ